MTDRARLQTLPARVTIQPDRLPVMQPGSWRTDTMTTSERGYGWKWQQARVGWLRKHPLCVYCEREGRVTAATVVDHIQAHRGDMRLFWASETNWQSLCASCHSGTKAKEEQRSSSLR